MKKKTHLLPSVAILSQLLLFLLFAPSASAQVALHAGYSPEQWATPETAINFHSYNAGVDFRVPIVGGLGVLVGVQGRWSTESDSKRFEVDTNHRTNIVAAEIPLLLNYNFRITDDFRITPFAGAKFSYYIKGRTRDANGHPINEWFDEENEARRMNRLNISSTFGLALSYSHFHLFGGYNIGLSDMDNVESTLTLVGGPFLGLAVGF